jgi:N-acetylmuramoyl-L-alanine amidase
MKPGYVIVHDSATADGQTVSANAIWDWHTGVHPLSPYGRTRPKMDTIGYHALNELVGTRYLTILGRPLYREGAHTIGWNQKALGYCFVGDFDKGPPPLAQLTKGAEDIAAWLHLFTIPLGHVLTHRDAAQDGRHCPGLMFPFADLLQLLSVELARWNNG